MRSPGVRIVEWLDPVNAETGRPNPHIAKIAGTLCPEEAQSLNRRTYRGVEKWLTRAQEHINRGKTIPIKSCHGAGEDTLAVAGKFTRLVGTGEIGDYEGLLSNTDAGRTLATSIDGGYIGGISLEGEKASFKVVEDPEKSPDRQPGWVNVTDMELKAAAFTNSPAIPTANVRLVESEGDVALVETFEVLPPKEAVTTNKAGDSAGDFLVAEDPDKPSTWHLQVKRSGQPDHGLMGAAYAALFTNYRGSTYSGPNEPNAKTALKALYTAEKMDWPGDSKKTGEALQSLTSIAERIEIGQPDLFKALTEAIEAPNQLFTADNQTAPVDPATKEADMGNIADELNKVVAARHGVAVQESDDPKEEPPNGPIAQALRTVSDARKAGVDSKTALESTDTLGLGETPPAAPANPKPATMEVKPEVKPELTPEQAVALTRRLAEAAGLEPEEAGKTVSQATKGQLKSAHDIIASLAGLDCVPGSMDGGDSDDMQSAETPVIDESAVKALVEGGLAELRTAFESQLAEAVSDMEGRHQAEIQEIKNARRKSHVPGSERLAEVEVDKMGLGEAMAARISGQSRFI